MESGGHLGCLNRMNGYGPLAQRERAVSKVVSQL